MFYAEAVCSTEKEYALAWQEGEDTGDEALWEHASADGLSDDAFSIQPAQDGGTWGVGG